MTKMLALVGVGLIGLLTALAPAEALAGAGAEGAPACACTYRSAHGGARHHRHHRPAFAHVRRGYGPAAPASSRVMPAARADAGPNTRTVSSYEAGYFGAETGVWPEMAPRSNAFPIQLR